MAYGIEDRMRELLEADRAWEAERAAARRASMREHDAAMAKAKDGVAYREAKFAEARARIAAEQKEGSM